jgi:hypothetical protein
VGLRGSRTFNHRDPRRRRGPRVQNGLPLDGRSPRSRPSFPGRRGTASRRWEFKWFGDEHELFGPADLQTQIFSMMSLAAGPLAVAGSRKRSGYSRMHSDEGLPAGTGAPRMNVPWSHAPRSLEDGQDFPLQDNQQAFGNRQGRPCVTQPTGAFLCLQLADA